MEVIVVVNSKGGTGKSTLTVSLATAAAAAGVITQILDGDPLGATYKWNHMRRVSGRPDFVTDPATSYALRNSLAKASAAGVQLVIIDTGAGALEATHTAIALADLVLVPLRPQPLELMTLGSAISMITAALHDRVPAPPVVAVWVGGQSRRAHKIYREAGEFVAKCGVTLMEPGLTHRSLFHQMFHDGSSVFESGPKTDAARETAEVWRDVAGRLGLASIAETIQ